MEKSYWEIAPANKAYHSGENLTYSSLVSLKTGQLVELPLRNKPILGVVLKQVKKPDFATKDVGPTELFIPKESLELLDWMRDYYPSSLGVSTNLFLPPSLKLQAPDIKISRPLKTRFGATVEQTEVIKKISLNQAQTYVLHGETGSGKTKIYLDLARKVIGTKSVLILVPEIGLSPQLYKEFQAEFGERVIMNHSGMTPKQRRETWARVNTEEPVIVIGPRSALFLPFRELGLVVVDEFHEGAYKQESAPYYSGLRVASKLSQLHSCPLILGSATPSVNEYFWAEQKQIPILTLKKISRGTNENFETKTISVDLSDNNERSNQPLLSRTLLKEVKKTLDSGEQILLFLNKRGSARVIVCQSCGWRSKCSRCDLPMTYHQDAHQLVCHTCGNKAKPPISCPDCKSTEVMFKSPGTKSISDHIQKLFPAAKVARFDKDNTKAERLDTLHSEVVKGDIDILVGTQVLAKGHDLPKLGLVAILQAESGLHFPDYTANERSYQLIHQLMGRVGRGHRKGTVVIQTFNKDALLLQSALKNDWQNFYTQELKERKQYGFPPFFHTIKITATRKTAISAKTALNKIVTEFEQIPGLTIVGPSPCFIEKKLGKYHWQIVIKSKNRAQLVKIAKKNLNGFTVDLDPAHLL